MQTPLQTARENAWRKTARCASFSLALLMMAALVLLAPASALAQSATVWLERSHETREEGEDVRFTVRRTVSSLVNTTVTVALTLEGGFFSSSQPTRQTVTFTGIQSHATITVPTVDDDVDEADGSVTATIVAGDGYTVGNTDDKPGSATTTVTNDDHLPVLSIVADAETVQEGGTATFKLRREGSATNPITVRLITGYRPFGSSETDGWGVFTDYANYTIPAGGENAEVTVTIATEQNEWASPDDWPTSPEADLSSSEYRYTPLVFAEFFSTLDTDTYRISASGSGARIRIVDDDPLKVDIAPVSATVSEGDGHAEFEVRRVFVSDGEVHAYTGVRVEVSVSVAQTGSFIDGDITTAQVVLERGDFGKEIQVPLDDDSADENNGLVTATIAPDESFQVLGSSIATVTVTDDDPSVVVIAADQESVAEGEDATFTLTRSVATDVSLDVRVHTEEPRSPLAQPFNNPTSKHRTVTFAEGSATATLTVSVTADDIYESGDWLNARVEPLSSDPYNAGTPDEATILITNDDLEEVTVAAEDTERSEGDGTAVFTLTRKESRIAFTAQISVTQEGDFLSGTRPTEVEFAKGSLTADITLQLDDDSVNETDGSVTVEVTVPEGADYTAGTPGSATTDVIDDDQSKVWVEASGYAPAGWNGYDVVWEENDAVFILKRDGHEDALTVNVYVTARNSGQQTVTFAAGVSTAEVRVPTYDDEDPNIGHVSVRVRDGDTYMVDQNRNDATMAVRDVFPQAVSISSFPTSVDEGTAIDFTFARCRNLTSSHGNSVTRCFDEDLPGLTVDLAVTDEGGSIDGSPPGQISFDAGSSTVALSMNTQDDKIYEGDLPVTVEITASDKAQLGNPSSATVTVIDDEQIPVLDVDHVTATEADGEIEFEVELDLISPSTGIARAVTVDYTTADVTAKAGDDYTSASGTLTFGTADLSAQSITVTVANDALHEPDETFTLSLSNAQNAVLKGGVATLAATGTLAASDPPELSIAANAAVIAESADAVFTLTRTTVGTALTVNVQVTAEGGFLDGTPPASVTFGAMSTTATLTVPTDDDNVSEYNGAVIATIAGNAAYTIASGAGEARVVVQDNEEQEITFIDYTTSSSSPHEVSEGDDIAFTVKRIGNTDDALTVSLILTHRLGSGYSQDLLAHISISDATPVSVTSPEGVTPVYVNVTFPAEGATVDVRVPTDADEVDEPDIIVVVLVHDDDASDYRAHSGRDEIRFIVRDLPNVTITPAATPVAESASAVFNLARTSDTGVMQVQVDMTEVGAFLASPGRTTVTFASGDLATTLTVSLDDDDLDEVDGSVTATVAAGSGYRLGNPASATVTVTDDDLQQVVSLEAESTSVTEGNDIVFTLRRYTVLGPQSYEDNTRGSLTVNVQVTLEGPSLSGASSATTATFDAGETAITLRFPTSVTATDVNGSVTATIAAGTGYTVSDPASVTVVVTDEGQTVSIAPKKATVTEGEDAVFTMTRTGDTANPLRVRVRLGGQTKIATSETRERMETTFWVEFGAGKASTDLTLTTHDDEINEGDGEIYAELKGYTTYKISGNARTEVLIKDDDIPVMSTEQSVINMIEGNPIVWTFIRTGDTSSGLSFNIGASRTFNHPYQDFNSPYEVYYRYFRPGQSKSSRANTGGHQVYVGPAGGEAFVEVLPYHCENEPCFDPRYTVGEPSSTTYRVANRFPTIYVSAAAESVEEGDPAVFTLERVWNPENLAEETTVVTFQVTGSGGVISGAPPTTVTFAAAETRKTLSVPTLENAIDDDGGSVTVQLNGVDDLAAGTLDATYVIQDYEVDGVNLSRATVAVTDDDGGNSALSLTRSAPAYFQSEGQALSLTYTVENTGTVATGTPIVVHDTKLGQITCSEAALAANANVTCTGSYTVTAADVSAQEIVSTAYAAIGQKESNRVVATVALQSSSVTLSVSPGEVGEGAGATDLTVTATLDAKPFTADTNVTLSVSAGTAATTDYSATTATLTIPAEKTSGTATLTLTPVDDAVDEADETVTVEGAVSGLTVTGATVTIIDDDLSALSITDADAAENAGSVTFTVSLSVASSDAVTVDYATSDSTAKAGLDYTAANGSVTFNPGDALSRTISVTIANDDVDEADEAFKVTLSNALKATLAGGESTLEAIGTITDDDERGVEVEPERIGVYEGRSKPYTVVLKSQPTANVTVTVNVPSGTDVSVDETTLIFTADNWNTAQTVTVRGARDADVLQDAPVTITHTVRGGDYGKNGVTASDVGVLIVENDTPTLSIEDAVADEDDGTIVFTVSLSPTSSQTVTVAWSTGDGTATVGEDYTAANGTLTFPANSADAQTISITVADDDVDEADETFKVTLSNARNATLAGGSSTLSVTGTIADDDERGVTVSPEALTVTEGGSKTYEVVLTSQPTEDVTVTVTVPTGADVSVDTDPNQQGDQNTLTFTADDWETARTVTVRASEDDDAVADADVTLTDTVGSTGDYSGETASNVVVTIAENDSPAPALTLTFEAPSHNDVDNSGHVTVGDVLSYQATATNSGNVPLTEEVRVSDLLVDVDGVACASLALGEKCELTGDYTVTQADVDAGEVTNTATAAASGISDRTESRTTPVAQEKALTLAKTTTTASFRSVGDRIGYSYEVTNSGTVTLTGALAITDDKIPASGITCPAVPASGLGPGASLTCTGSHTVVQEDVDVSRVTNKATATLDGVASNEAAVRVTRPQVNTEVPAVSMSGVAGLEDAGTFSFEVTLDKASAQTVRVSFETTDGTAVAGKDYTAASGTLTFAPGTTSQTISVTIADDDIDEENEAFTVTLSDAVNATLATTSANGTIGDDDTHRVLVMPTSLSLVEGGPSKTYSIVLNSEPTATVTVEVEESSIVGVTVDPVRLRFDADDWNTAQTVTVRADDDVDADDARAELIHRVLGGDYAGLAASKVTVAVDDDETASTVVTLSVSPETVVEDVGAAGQSVTVTATLNEAPRTVATEVTVSVGAGTAQTADFAAVTPFAVTIAAGQTSGSGDFTLTPADDDVDEADETVWVSGTATGSGLTVERAAVTITDDDERGVTVTPTALTVDEGGSKTYTVVLTSEPTANVTVRVSVPQGTDVSVDETRLTFTADNWNTEQTVTVSAAEDDDAVVNAAVTVTHAVSGGDYGDNPVTASDVEVTITETDTPTLGIEDADANEDAGSVTFTVSLSVASSKAVTVGWATSDLPADAQAGGTATAGEDYTAVTNGSVTFNPGDALSRTISVTIANDDVDEADETFTVTLSNPQNATMSTATATATISDDDERGVTVDPTALTLDEGDDNTYTVVLTSEPTADVTVTVSVPQDTDVSVDETRLTFTTNDWDTEQTVPVSASDDDDAVADAAVTLTHSATGGDYSSEQASIEVTIVETDTPTLSIRDADADEDDGSVTFAVNLSTASSRTVTVAWATGDGTATAGKDYTSVTNGTLIFPANSTTAQTISVTIRDDNIDEEHETFEVTLSNARNATLAGGSSTLSVTGTIADDDERGVTVSPEALTVTEGGSKTYEVVLTSQPTEDVTVTVTVPTGADVSVDTDPNQQGDQNTLTFTADDWETARTVTVRASEDDDAVADADVTLTDTVGSTGDYSGETASNVVVTIAENDSPAPALTLTFEAPSHNDVDNSGHVTVGDVLSYQATATNSGNVPLTEEVRVSDLLVDVDGVACASLALGEKCELTGDYTVTQADVDAGEVTNTATAAASGISDRTESRTTPVAQEKALTLAKTTTTASFRSVGDRIGYSYEVTNSGTVTLTGALAITDDKIPASGITCPAVPASGLGPGASLTCTGSHTVVQEDVDVSRVTNKATATLDGVASNEAAVRVTRPQVNTEVPAVSMSGVAGLEDAGTFSFEVTLDKASAQTVRVSFETTDGTAVAGKDYTAASGTLTFAPGTTSQTISVTIADDDIDEENEAFTVTLSDAVNATLATTSANGTIGDDDTHRVLVMPTSLSLVEGGPSKTYSIVLNSEPTATVTVEVEESSIVGVTVDPVRLRFDADDWNTAQTVTVRADDDVDADDARAELIHRVLGGDYAGLAASKVTVAVDDDETASTVVTLSVSPETVVEDVGAAGQSVTVTATLNEAPRTVATEVTVSVGAGTAQTADFAAVTPFAVTIAAGQTSGSGDFTLTPADDDVDEADETVWVSGTATGSGLTVERAAVTITDDDERGVTVTPTALTVDEGGSKTYTVVLTSEPTANVTVRVSVPQGTDVSVDETRLTFTADNWNTEQTVTVSAAEDDDAVVNAAVTVTHAVSGGDYGDNPVTASDVEVTITETDTPTLSIGDADANEDAGSVTFTVSLSVASSKAVTVGWATSDLPADAQAGGTATAGEDYTAVTNGSVTFNPGDALSRTISVTIANDDVDEADETFTVTLGNPQNATIAAATATGRIEDDDERGVTVDPTALTVDEGGSKPYTVVLKSQPTADVIVTVSVPQGTDVSVDKTRLTFTADTWNTAQAVTVSAAEDDDAVVDAAAAIGHSANGGDYANESASVEVLITEADTPTLSIANQSAVEDAGTMSFTVTLSIATSRTVTVAWATGDGTATAGKDYTAVTAGSVTFNPGDALSRTISVTVNDDDIDEENETFEVTLSNARNATLAGGQPTLEATGTITDDDERGVTVDPTALTVSEGHDNTYSVVLTSQPTEDVTVTVSVPQGTDVSVDKTRLTFTPDTWDTEQTVTVSSAQDVDAEDDAATLEHTISGGDYGDNNVEAVSVTVEVDDDETASTTVTLTVGPETVAEDVGTAGQAVTVTATLNAAPRTLATAVTVSVGAGTAQAADFEAVSSFTLTIAAGQTSGRGTFALKPVNDAVVEENETVAVSGTAEGLTVERATVTITDDDGRGVTVTPTTLTVNEGDDDTYAVALTSQPTEDVTVTVSVPQDTDVSIDKKSLTFTADNWNTAQTVTVSAAADDDAVVDGAVTITHTVGGGDYGANSVTASDVEVTITETDTPTLSLGDASANEDDGSVTFTVGLSTASSNEVTVAWATGDGTATAGSDYTAANGTLTFPASGTTPQTVRVTIVNDPVDEENETFTVTLSNAQNATLAGGQPTVEATGTITDDDTRGVTVTPEKLNVPEGGSATYKVVLKSQPTEDVTVTVGVPQGTDVSVDKTRLTFTTSDWNAAQTVAVSAAADDDAVVDDAVTITHSVSGGDYGGNSVTASDVEVTITETTLPTLSIANQRVDEDAGTMVFEVRLSVASSNAVTVEYAMSDLSADAQAGVTAVAGSDYTATDGILTFPANSAAPQTIRATIANDAVDEENETFTVTLSNAQNAILTTPSATGTIEDDDERGVTVTPTQLPVTEGGSNTYVVVLTSQPTGDVTVGVSVPQGTDVSVDKTRLTFAADDWNTVQTVTVSAAEDNDAIADGAVTITHTVGSTGDYSGETASEVEVTIVETDTPTLSIEDAHANEYAGSVTFTVGLSTASSNAVTVAWATSDLSADAQAGGTATAGQDYTAANGTLTFPANSTTPRTISVTIEDDAIDEENETFAVTLSNARNATLDGGQPTLEAAGTITDDDTRGVTVTPTQFPVTEGGSNTYAVVLKSQPTEDVTVGVSVPPGTDVSVDKTRLTFTADTWNTAQAVTVRAAEDDDAVADATLILTHSATGGDYNSEPASIEVTIVENDTPTLSIGDADADENDGSVTFTVNLSVASSNEVTVAWSTGDGTATAGSDYTAANGTLTFPANNTTAQTISVMIANDLVDEANETFTVTLSNAQKPTLAGGRNTLSVTGTITDDDGRGVTVTPTTLTVNEGDDDTYAVALTSQPTEDVTVTVSVPQDTDVSIDKKSLTFTADNWNTAQTVTVSAAADDDAVVDGAVTITHTVGGGDYGANSVTASDVEVTITETDTPTLSLGDASANEDDGSVTFTVGLSTASSNEVTVAWATGDGTATAGSDYTAANGTLTFPASGTTPQTVRVTIVNDPVDEENETFTVTLSNAQNATLAGGQPTVEATGTITDDDTRGVTVTPEKLNVPEGGSATYKVVLKSQPTEDVTVTVGVPQDTDVSIDKARLSFTTSDWNVEQTVTVSAAADDDAVVDDAVTITHSVSGGDYGGNSVTASDVEVTITETTLPTLSIADQRVDEDAGTMVFEVRLSVASSNAVTVEYAVSDVTAVAGTDYTAANGTLTFPANSAAPQTIRATIANDAVDEENETFTVTLSNAQNAILTTPSATGTIEDDDERGVTVTPTTLTVNEGDDDAYVVVLTSRPTEDVTVDVNVLKGTDVSMDKTRLTFAADDWNTEQTVTVSTSEDNDAIADATVTITHTATGGDYDSESASVEVTIVETDTPTLSIANQRAAESVGTMVFTVTLSVASGNESTVTYATSDLSADAQAGGTASAGEDYTASEGTLTFPANSTTPQTIRIPILDDALDEADETFSVTLSNARHATLAGGGATLSATGTIVDDDMPGVTVSFGSATYTAEEGGSAAKVTIRLDGDSEREVAIPLTVTNLDGASDADCSWAPASLTFGAGEREQILTVTATDDRVDDDGERVRLAFGTLSNQVKAGSQATTVVTLKDNDARGVEVSPASLTLAGGSSGTYDVVLTSEPTDDVTVTIASHPDLSFDRTSLTFTAENWNRAQKVVLTAVRDVSIEKVTIGHTASGGDYANEPADVEVGILENRTPGVTVVSIRADAASVTEGGTAMFTLSRMGDVTVSLDVSVRVSREGAFFPGTPPATVTFEQGSGVAALPVGTEGDDLDEPDGSVTVAIAESDDYALSEPASATVRVTDDDDAPDMMIADARAGEGDRQMIFAVTLGAASGRAVTVDWATVDLSADEAGGTATAGEDYEKMSGTVRLRPRRWRREFG